MLEAVCDAKLWKSALARQIGPASGRSQADRKEVIHMLMEDSEFGYSSSCTGRWVDSGEARSDNVWNLCTCERERASAMELRRPETWVADTQKK